MSGVDVAARFAQTVAADDACWRWLDRVTDLGNHHPSWGKIRAVYEQTAQFVQDVDDWAATSGCDRFIEAEALADEPRIDSEFDAVREREWEWGS